MRKTLALSVALLLIAVLVAFAVIAPLTHSSVSLAAVGTVEFFKDPKGSEERNKVDIARRGAIKKIGALGMAMATGAAAFKLGVLADLYNMARSDPFAATAAVGQVGAPSIPPATNSSAGLLPIYSGTPLTPAPGQMWMDRGGDVRWFNGSTTESVRARRSKYVVSQVGMSVGLGAPNYSPIFNGGYDGGPDTPGDGPNGLTRSGGLNEGINLMATNGGGTIEMQNLGFIVPITEPINWWGQVSVSLNSSVLQNQGNLTQLFGTNASPTGVWNQVAFQKFEGGIFDNNYVANSVAVTFTSIFGCTVTASVINHGAGTVALLLATSLGVQRYSPVTSPNNAACEYHFVGIGATSSNRAALSGLALRLQGVSNPATPAQPSLQVCNHTFALIQFERCSGVASYNTGGNAGTTYWVTGIDLNFGADHNHFVYAVLGTTQSYVPSNGIVPAVQPVIIMVNDTPGVETFVYANFFFSVGLDNNFNGTQTARGVYVFVLNKTSKLKVDNMDYPAGFLGNNASPVLFVGGLNNGVSQVQIYDATAGCWIQTGFQPWLPGPIFSKGLTGPRAVRYLSMLTGGTGPVLTAFATTVVFAYSIGLVNDAVVIVGGSVSIGSIGSGGGSLQLQVVITDRSGNPQTFNLGSAISASASFASGMTMLGVRAGSTVTLQVLASGGPPASISWTWTGGLIPLA